MGLPYLRRSARLCVECGADIVKSNWPGSTEAFAEIVDCVPVPVVVAGGSRESDLDLLNKVAAALDGGASGCSIGRKHPPACESRGDDPRHLRGGEERQDPQAALEENLGGLVTT